MTSDPRSFEALKDWIGRTEEASDIITARLETSLLALFDRPVIAVSEGDAAMPTAHWCLTPPIAPAREISDDGHPRRGGFLPPVPLPRRMWAGGEITFLEPLRVGDRVERRSRVDDIAVKNGRSGTLCFVTVRHVYSTRRGPAIDERQDIVYRDADQAGPTRAVPTQAGTPAAAEAQWSRPWRFDEVSLFRYSAVTFNGHRIHYDYPYVTGTEGYPGLVVHGPLQASLLVNLACEIRGTAPRTFGYRGLRPLFAPASVQIEGRESGEGLDLWIKDEAGFTTMEGLARW